MYLQPKSVEETFRVIAKFAGKESQAVFDYVHASVLRQEGTCYGERNILKTVAKAGERWYFGIEKEEIERFLEKYGLIVIDHKDAWELEHMYFRDSAGKIVGRINGTHCLVRGEKK